MRSWLQRSVCKSTSAFGLPQRLSTCHFRELEEEMANPLQCSCLENPRDGGAWWAAVSGVAQSRTRLKRLSSSSNGSGVNNLPTVQEIQVGLIPEWGRSPGGGNGNPLQYSCLENPTDRGA